MSLVTQLVGFGLRQVIGDSADNVAGVVAAVEQRFLVVLEPWDNRTVRLKDQLDDLRARGFTVKDGSLRRQDHPLWGNVGGTDE